MVASSDAGGERPELDLPLGADELGQRQGRVFSSRVLDQHQGEEELVPGRDEREQRGGDEARSQQRQHDADQDTEPPAPSTAAASSSSRGMAAT